MRRSVASRSAWILAAGGALAVAAVGVAAKASLDAKETALTRKGFPYVKGELLVKTTSKASLERFAAQEGIGMLVERQAITEGTGGSWHKVKFDSEESMQEAYDAASKVEGVVHVEPNYIYSINLGGPKQPPGGDSKGPDYVDVPALPTEPKDDPELSKLYGLQKIKAADAWKIQKGSANVVVADIDTGIDYNHPDLINNVWRNPKEIPGNDKDDDNNGFKDDIVGYDFRDKDARPFDDNQHGSHTSGTIAATGGNGIGISGVAQRASIMGLRFLGGAQGSGSSEDAILAIEYATANGAQIMSNSWGGGAYSQALFDVIKKASDKGILFVAAAGNSAQNIDKTATYPAGYDLPNIISVAATDSSDKLASFSNYGAKKVALAAPGANIFSTVPGGKYAQFSGTSMACPHVAGAAAVVKAAFPSFKAKELIEALTSSVDELPGLKDKVSTGGRLNVAKALENAANILAR